MLKWGRYIHKNYDFNNITTPSWPPQDTLYFFNVSSKTEDSQNAPLGRGKGREYPVRIYMPCSHLGEFQYIKDRKP